MKAVDKKKPIHTIPDGVWEGSSPETEKERDKQDITTDLQGNGYPVKEQSE